ncbi:DUF2141 domain-containing protein [Erythrobacter sp. WG]|uniref:DUF2141 domain-containing protein n=1 Tax=Erythrobacter sp. WG TaxID=2985510 RepID=UPI00227211D3|nr:DUF2141 domain-containing protein [Erythrobacter sp. WG]MCX9145894.1 DUF2141 domain-containing protein [Erythrobacter sp. WG]
MTFRLVTPLLLAAAALPLGGCAISINDPGAPSTSIARGSAANLAIRFEGIETPKGQIMLSVFDNAAAHDQNGAPVRVAAVPVDGTTAIASFEGLAPGDYAVKAFHDIDGDGKMGTNPFGMPIEPYAFSNNAKVQGGPPRWEAARFPVAAGANTISIAIK